MPDQVRHDGVRLFSCQVNKPQPGSRRVYQSLCGPEHTTNELICKRNTKMKRNVVSLGKIAHKLKREGRIREAEETYIQMLCIDSNSVYALVGLGDLKRGVRRFEEASDYYKRCLEIEKNNWYALAGLGDTYRGLRDLDKALEAWYYCLKLRPDDHRTMTRVADGLRKKGELDNSKKYYFMALEKYPFDPYALMGLGQIAMKEGDDDEALDFFEKLIEISEKPVVALTSAANIFRKRKAFQKAMVLYERALKFDPENSYAWHGKADCLRGMKKYRSAIEAWEIALENGMDQRAGLTRIGDSYISLNELDLAEASYRKAITAMGYDKYAYLGISKVHTRKDALDKALEILLMLRQRESEDQRISEESRRFLERYPEIEKSTPIYTD